MNIAVFGCSFSAGIFEKSNTDGGEMFLGNEWTTVLSKKLDCTIHNFSSLGSCNSDYILKLYWCLSNLDIDIFIFQTTYPWRQSFGIDGNTNLQNLKFTKSGLVIKDEFKLFDEIKKVGNVFYYNSNKNYMLNHSKSSSKETRLAKVNRFKDHNPEENDDNYLQFLNFWDDNVSTSTINLYEQSTKTFSHINLLLKDKKYLIFPWTDSCHVNFDNTIFDNFIDKTKIINTSTEQSLLNKYGKEWYASCIQDSGRHLNEEAHLKITEEYILPELQNRKYI